MASEKIPFTPPWTLVLVFFLLACGIGTAAYLFYLDQRSAIRKERQNELLAVAELKSAAVSDWRSQHLDDANVIGGNPLLLSAIDRWVRSGAPDSPMRRDILRWMEGRQRHYHYSRMLLADSAGRPLITVPADPPFAVTPLHRSMFGEAARTGKAVFSDIYRDSSTKEFRFEAVIPLGGDSDGAGRPAALMLIRSDPGRSLFPLLRYQPAANGTAESLLVRRDGDAVLYLNQPRHAGSRALMLRRPISDRGLVSAMAVLGREGILTGTDYRGHPVIAAVKRIPDSSWALVVKVDADEVYAPIRKRARLLAGLTALLLLAADFAVFLFWRQGHFRLYRELYEAEREHAAAALEAERELQRKQRELEALNRSLEERVSAEVERNREMDHLLIQQSRLAAMGEMIGNIAHQWRQPLNVVGLLFQSLSECHRRGELNEEILEDTVQQAMEVIAYMSRTMNDFRNFFRPEKEKAEFQIREVVEKSISFLQPHLHHHGIELNVRIDDGLRVCGYPNEYSQVLINIIGNAKDIFLDRGTEKPAISITAHREGGRTVVSIADNGGGVPEEILPRIFDPYFTCRQSGEGTGLGLYMSKTIIEKNMGGETYGPEHPLRRRVPDRGLKAGPFPPPCGFFGQCL